MFLGYFVNQHDNNLEDILNLLQTTLHRPKLVLLTGPTYFSESLLDQL